MIAPVNPFRYLLHRNKTQPQNSLESSSCEPISPGLSIEFFRARPPAGVSFLSHGSPAVRGLVSCKRCEALLSLSCTAFYYTHYSLPVPQLPPNKRLTVLYLTISINMVYCFCSLGHGPFRPPARHAPPPRRPSNSTKTSSPTRVTTL